MNQTTGLCILQFFLYKNGMGNAIWAYQWNKYVKRENDMENVCRARILSEDYLDLIVQYGSGRRQPNDCVISIMDRFEIYYWPRDWRELSINNYSYFAIPKLFGLLDTSNMEASGIIALQNQPILNLSGENVLIGFIDTGIDYQNPVFLGKDGKTRIVAIWDQEDQSGNAPEDFFYGSEYLEEAINEAILSEKAYEIVPSKDENGHGTFLAGIAAGKMTEDGMFTGAAVDAKIAMVKLKPAKKYLRDFFFIKEDAIAYQENDIMTGLAYLRKLAKRLQLPLVVCLGVGSNQGGHTGATPLSRVMGYMGSDIGTILVAAAGNETGRSHHYLGMFSQKQEMEPVEIRVGEKERGFSLEFWAQAPEVYSISLLSPTGESIPRVPARLGRSEVASFIFEKSVVYIDYQIVEPISGGFLIVLRFQDPTPGVWTIQVYNSLFISGRYDMWLPMEGFLNPDTVFLKPNPDTTLCVPATGQQVISISTYNHTDGSLYQHSSRGYTRDDKIKPDITAPGVSVYGPGKNNQFVRKTGSSIAAAHVAGAAALLLEWAVGLGNRPAMNTNDALTFFIRGADRRPDLVYPNREWGFGTLNAYQIFDRLRNV